MEVFSKQNWKAYKKYIKDFNRQESKNLPMNTICGYLKEPTFVGYMDFVFSEDSE